jgi:hypothetical protein
MFQSLIGILAIWKSAWLKGLLYWVFKVHLRESPAIIAFQEGSGQYTTCSNPLKTSFSKTFRICATPGFGVRAFHSWCDQGCSPKFRSFTKNTNPFALLKNTSINKIWTHNAKTKSLSFTYCIDLNILYLNLPNISRNFYRCYLG